MHNVTFSGLKMKNGKVVLTNGGSINLNGHLCAKVLEIRPLAVKNDMYEVTCIEYRSGSKTKVYHMDAKKRFCMETVMSKINSPQMRM